MKQTTTQYWWQVAAALALTPLFIGCDEEVNDGWEGGRAPITFQSQDTRATLKESFSPEDLFTVWNHRSLGSEVQCDFDGVPVTLNNKGEWSYDTPRFWRIGWSYDYYALYRPVPANLSISRDDATGALSSTAYDLKTHQEDILWASNTGINYQDGSDNTVALDFKHAFAQLQLQGRDDFGNGVTVKAVRFMGMAPSATLDLDAAGAVWTQGESLTAPYCELTPNKTLGTTASELFDGGMLVFPGIVSGNYYFEVEYTVQGDDNKKTVKYYPATAGSVVPEWLPGRKYTYTFAVKDAQVIVFDNPTVATWAPASGGITIVVKPG